MNFGKNRFVEGFRKRLPEFKRAEIVDIGPREKTAPYVGAARHIKIESAFLPALAVAQVQPTVVHAVKHRIEIRPGARLATKIDVMSKASLRKILHAIREIVAAINGPEVAHADHFSPTGAVPDIRREEPRPPGSFFQRLVKE